MCVCSACEMLKREFARTLQKQFSKKFKHFFSCAFYSYKRKKTINSFSYNNSHDREFPHTYTFYRCGKIVIYWINKRIRCAFFMSHNQGISVCLTKQTLYTVISKWYQVIIFCVWNNITFKFFWVRQFGKKSVVKWHAQHNLSLIVIFFFLDASSLRFLTYIIHSTLYLFRLNCFKFYSIYNSYYNMHNSVCVHLVVHVFFCRYCLMFFFIGDRPTRTTQGFFAHCKHNKCCHHTHAKLNWIATKKKTKPVLRFCNIFVLQSLA